MADALSRRIWECGYYEVLDPSLDNEVKLEGEGLLPYFHLTDIRIRDEDAIGFNISEIDQYVQMEVEYIWKDINDSSIKGTKQIKMRPCTKLDFEKVNATNIWDEKTASSTFLSLICIDNLHGITLNIT